MKFSDISRFAAPLLVAGSLASCDRVDTPSADAAVPASDPIFQLPAVTYCDTPNADCTELINPMYFVQIVNDSKTAIDSAQEVDEVNYQLRGLSELRRSVEDITRNNNERNEVYSEAQLQIFQVLLSEINETIRNAFAKIRAINTQRSNAEELKFNTWLNQEFPEAVQAFALEHELVHYSQQEAILEALEDASFRILSRYTDTNPDFGIEYIQTTRNLYETRARILRNLMLTEFVFALMEALENERTDEVALLEAKIAIWSVE